nr:proteolipid protein 2-like [Pelodiscus sinensis]|eukprot:XP_006110460.2 proteolipid protein 2-like [Pelodiscus sinensis]
MEFFLTIVPSTPAQGLCIIILICYGASYTPGYTGLAICEMVLSIIFFIVYTLGLNKQLTFVHWGWSDFIRAVIGALLFLITSLIVLIGHRDGPGIAAGVFGLLAGILFAYDAYITLPTLRKSHTAAPTESPEGV